MQRMGGGSRKAKRGGGNDPRCGCDMRVGWPADLKAQGGGGSCGSGIMAPLMRGGGCGCGNGGSTGPLFPQGGGRRGSRRGRKATRKTRKGAGLLFANGGAQCCPGQVLRFANHTGGSLCGDFGCPFKGTGYCDFYAKGGAWGNHHYGEPIYMQAKFRGGANASGVSVSINEIEDLIQDYRAFLNEYQPLAAGEIVDKGRYEQMYADFNELAEKFKDLDDELDGELSDALQAKKIELYGVEAQAEQRDQQYYNASGLENANANNNEQGGGYKPTKKNLKYLRRYKQGKSIGFTMRSSLKAKGLIPRSSRKHRGKKIVSAKYK